MIPIRLRLTNDPTIFWFGPGGVNDDSHGQSQETPWADPQYAIDWVCNNVDCNGCAIQIKQTGYILWPQRIVLGDPMGVKKGGWPAKALSLTGDLTGINSTLVSSGTDAFLSIDSCQTWWIEGFQVQAVGCDLNVDFGSRVYWGKNFHGGLYNPPGTPLIPYPSQLKICAQYKSMVEIMDDVYIRVGGQTVLFSVGGSTIIQKIGKIYVCDNLTFGGGLTYCDSSSLLQVPNIQIGGF
jgi:hypothetical protein